MSSGWGAVLSEHPELRDFSQWPQVDPLTLPEDKRAHFLRNIRLVSLVLIGNTATEAAKQVNLSVPSATRILQRSLCETDGERPLTKGLIPNQRLRPDHRRQPLPTLTNPRGSRSAMQHLLETVPLLQQRLDEVIASFLKHRATGQNLTPKSFHKAFLRMLADTKHPADAYPFTERKLGYESVRRYFHRRCAEMLLERPVPKRIIRSVTSTEQVFDNVEIDAYTTDIITRIDLDFNGQLTPLRLARATLLLATETLSDCHLGFQLCLQPQPSQDDILRLFSRMFTPAPLPVLKTPGIEYGTNAGFPTSLPNPVAHIGVIKFHLDNALAHLAHSIQHYLCDVLGATYNLGLPAHPKGRNVIEFCFRRLCRHLHQFPSTTGSHSHDPVRESRTNHKKPPAITLQGLEDVITATLATHNGTPQFRLGNQSPLGFLQAKYAQQWTRHLPELEHHQLNPLLRRQRVTVRWIRKEKRTPHINFYKVRYTGQALRHADFVNKQITVEFHVDDIRTLKCYRNTGEFLGEVKAPLSWQAHAHSLTTRKRIYALNTTTRLAGVDPLTGYFSYLLAKKESPKYAMEIGRVFREFVSENAPSTEQSIAAHPRVLDQSTSLPVIPDWQTLVQTRSE